MLYALCALPHAAYTAIGGRREAVLLARRDLHHNIKGTQTF